MQVALLVVTGTGIASLWLVQYMHGHGIPVLTGMARGCPAKQHWPQQLVVRMLGTAQVSPDISLARNHWSSMLRTWAQVLGSFEMLASFHWGRALYSRPMPGCKPCNLCLLHSVSFCILANVSTQPNSSCAAWPTLLQHLLNSTPCVACAPMWRFYSSGRQNLFGRQNLYVQGHRVCTILRMTSKSVPAQMLTCF